MSLHPMTITVNFTSVRYIILYAVQKKIISDIKINIEATKNLINNYCSSMTS